MGTEGLVEKGIVVDHAEHRRDSTGTGRRRSSFDQAKLDMILPDKTHLAEGTTMDSIEDMPVSWFVWLVAFTASVAGSLFVGGPSLSFRDDANLS